MNHKNKQSSLNPYIVPSDPKALGRNNPGCAIAVLPIVAVISILLLL